MYVTNAWQSMCSYTMPQAIDQNPRLTQGEGTDPETVRSMRKALTARQPCKVRLINYRGYNREPFWNCLSVHPIFFNRECVLFAARLQDYSYRLSRLVSLQPSQFCKAGDHFQMKVRLSEINSAKRCAAAHRRSAALRCGPGRRRQQQHEHRLRRLISGGRLLRDEQRRWELG